MFASYNWKEAKRQVELETENFRWEKVAAGAPEVTKEMDSVTFKNYIGDGVDYSQASGLRSWMEGDAI